MRKTRFGLTVLLMTFVMTATASAALNQCIKAFGGRLPNEAIMVPIGVSNRHIHLSRADLEVLFGADYQLQTLKPLKQPGQFAAQETVTLVGPRGQIENVRILGPERKATQAEVSQADTFKLGIKAPVRDSGDLEGSAGITVIGPNGSVTLAQGVILAARHIHMNTTDAIRLGLKDKDRVQVRFTGERGVTYNNVLVRVSDSYVFEMHLDMDEANAALIQNGDQAEIILPPRQQRPQ